MKQSLTTRLILWNKIRKDRRINDEKPLRLSDGGLEITSILIILPNSWNEVRLAEHFLKSSFGNETRIRVKYCCNQEFASHLDDRIRSNLITYFQVDHDRYGFPTEGFIKQLFIQHYDAVIDLNSNFNIFSGWLTRRSQAAVRIGYNSDYADDFYNIILDKSETSLMEKGFRNIQKVIGI
jgi:hypothetical protein